jgi:exopolyphosphatase/guanosine-5'-triphosphate,3'-diphosphate pyrophosphatase
MKTKLRLAEHVGADGTLGAPAVGRLCTAVADTVTRLDEWQVSELFSYATAVVRDAPNREQVLSAVYERAGIRLGLLTGVEEAQLTFLAARRWMGWQAGPFLLFDIGGGSMEIAFGHDVVAEFAVSLPLGAGRLTRELLRGDPPDRRAIKAARRAIRDQIGEVATRLRWERPRMALATSRTFHQLARLCGAAPMRDGPFVSRVLRRVDLKTQLERLAGLPARERSMLPGISAARARQALAGALIAHTAMSLLRVDSVAICPWALREGILLRRLESAAGWREHVARLPVRIPRPAVPPPDPQPDATVLPLDLARARRTPHPGS